MQAKYLTILDWTHYLTYVRIPERYSPSMEQLDAGLDYLAVSMLLLTRIIQALPDTI